MMFWSLGDMYALCMGVECGLQIIQTKGTWGSALMLLIFNMYKAAFSCFVKIFKKPLKVT